MIRTFSVPFGPYKTCGRIAGARTGGKKPLVLLHGGPGSTAAYFEVLDAFAEEDGRELVTYDQLGCGGSYIEGKPELFTKETWTEELVNLREKLGLRECHLLGQSWGGMLLLTYMTAYRPAGVRSIVLSSTLSSSRLWGEEQHRMIRELPADMQAAIQAADETGVYAGEAYERAEAEFMRRHCAGPFTESDPECVRRKVKKGRESYLAAWGPNEFTPLGTLRDYDVTDRLGEIETPALVISGGNDLCTPYIAKTMADGLKNARWELFRDCRHMCFTEDLPRYTALLKEFLNEND